MADRRGEPGIEVEHPLERRSRLAHALIEQVAEVVVELAEHVPRLRIVGRALGRALEPGQRRQTVAARQELGVSVEQQAVGIGQAALVQHRAPQRRAEPLLGGVHLRGDEGEAQPPDGEPGIGADHARVPIARRAIVAPPERRFGIQIRRERIGPAVW